MCGQWQSVLLYTTAVLSKIIQIIKMSIVIIIIKWSEDAIHLDYS